MFHILKQSSRFTLNARHWQATLLVKILREMNQSSRSRCRVENVILRLERIAKDASRRHLIGEHLTHVT